MTSRSNEPFEYQPQPGIYVQWALSCDDGDSVDDWPFALHALSEVEAAIEQIIDEATADGISVSRVTGNHGWRTFELSNGNTIKLEWSRIPIDYRCAGCGHDTIDEGYMVTDGVWAAAGLAHDDGWFCIECLETGLGRQLTPADFLDVPMNTDPHRPRSPRLRDRLGDTDTSEPQKPKVTYDAPIASLDFEAFDKNGNSYEITACHECLPWRAEVVRDPEDNRPIVREWHAVECPLLVELLDEQNG